MIGRRALVLLAMLIALVYARSPLYDFPAPRPFHGNLFFNPYSEAAVHWQRANLHAHAWAWYGITNGVQSPSEIVDAYDALGYSIAGVSDYHHIAAADGVRTIPLYEHGYNLAKRHQLAIGARAVESFDFPFWQFPSHEQFIIDRVRSKADLVALAHPSRDAYSMDDLTELTGYDLIEVGNGPFIMEDAWDAALSSGHPVWAIANDDTHDLNDRHRRAVAWNMIGAPTTSTADVVGALRAGRTFAVVKTDEDPAPVDPSVPGVSFSDGTLVVSTGEPSAFLFIGQNGAVRKSVKYATEAAYSFAPEDTYIRAVVRSARTATFVNPVIRYDGRLPSPAASVDAKATWLMRGGYLLGAAALLFLLFGRKRLRRVAPAPAQVVAIARRKRA
jgi:hypothetical protein